jgi:hypothetical protein
MGEAGSSIFVAGTITMVYCKGMKGAGYASQVVH